MKSEIHIFPVTDALVEKYFSEYLGKDYNKSSKLVSNAKKWPFLIVTYTNKKIVSVGVSINRKTTSTDSTKIINHK